MAKEFSESQSGHLPVLHALRAIAALMVLACHFEIAIFREIVANGTVDKDSFGYQFFVRAGVFGVDLFFYLSGFIMVYTTRRNTRRDACGFLLKRLLRIFPLYWLCLGCYWLLVKPDTSLGVVLRSVLLLPLTNASPPFFGPAMLGVAWTLTYEMIFYSLFALALRFSSPRISQGFLVSAIIFFMVFGLQWLLAGALTLNPNDAPTASGSGVRYALLGVMANPLFIQFVVGALCGQLFLAMRARTQTVLRPQLWVAAASLIIATPFLYWLLPCDQHGWWGMATPAMTVFTGGAIADYLQEPLRLKSIDLLGDWSYGIYLTHQVIIESIASQLPDFWPEHEGAAGFLLLSVLVFSISCIAHRVVELPSMALARWVIALYFPRGAHAGR